MIQRAGLKLKFKRLPIFTNDGKIPGPNNNNRGYTTRPGKKDKIAFPTPCSKLQIQSFLGLAGYYHRFITNFGTIAHALIKQTTKSHKGKFEILSDYLISPPILAYPQFDLEFLLFTDASNYGIGAILSQIQNEQEVVIAYASRHLMAPELKYATVEKEALAVIFGIKRFKHYLLDNPFTVINDHHPLQWLVNYEDETGPLG